MKGIGMANQDRLRSRSLHPHRRIRRRGLDKLRPGAYDARKVRDFPIPKEACSMGSLDYNREPQTTPAGSLDTSSNEDPARQSPAELREESRKIRRLQMVVNMVSQVIAQDSTLSVEDASEMVADTRRVALGMFPDKELAFNLIYWPRLQRLMRERFRMQ
jgi:hypothetical protein